MKSSRMTRRINHTGRKKIERSNVSISIVEHDQNRRSFTADLALKALDLPGDAKVFVEAYYKQSIQRFSFGTVSNIRTPESTSLDEIDHGGTILFRVKVVDSTSKVGRLLAAAERINAKGQSDEDNRDYLVTLKTADLGEDIWRMELSSDIKPCLIINNRIPNASVRVKSDPVFQGLILPAMVRDVLTYLFWDEECHIDEETWQVSWIEYCENLTTTDLPENGDPGELRNWMDDVVTKFCNSFRLGSRLVNQLTEDAR
ncbi:hypothetical protein IID22_03560 [Patescibacteria group bacterium]|nr:hypothetical protein [Patescibacteria group bacterium]